MVALPDDQLPPINSFGKFRATYLLNRFSERLVELANNGVPLGGSRM